MAEIHAAAMRIGRPWSVQEMIATLTWTGSVLVEMDDGFAIGSVTLDEAELLTIAVDPAAQRQGVGRDCLTRFHAVVRDRGAATVFLEVAEANGPARALYARAGYTEIGRRADYYGPGDDALVLRLTLEP